MTLLLVMLYLALGPPDLHFPLVIWFIVVTNPCLDLLKLILRYFKWQTQGEIYL